MGKTTVTLVFALVLAFVLVSFTSAAVIQIQGKVYNGTMSPNTTLSNASVTVTCGNSSAATTSDSSGAYSINFNSSSCDSAIIINAPSSTIKKSHNVAISISFPSMLSPQATASYPGLKNESLSNSLVACAPFQHCDFYTVINPVLYKNSSVSLTASTNCFYNITDSTGKIIVKDTGMSCSADSKSTRTLPNGKYILNAFANDTLGNSNSTLKSFIVSVSSSSGGGGGGGGGTCVTQWNCTAWSSCVGGLQIRTCSYPSNFCKPVEVEPATNQTCVSASVESNTTSGTTSSSSAPVTGGVIGALGGTTGILMIILLIAVIALALFFASRKKSSKVEKSE